MRPLLPVQEAAFARGLVPVADLCRWARVARLTFVSLNKSESLEASNADGWRPIVALLAVAPECVLEQRLGLFRAQALRPEGEDLLPGRGLQDEAVGEIGGHITYSLNRLGHGGAAAGLAETGATWGAATP